MTQPLAGVEYRSLLSAVIEAGKIRRIDAAVAYATHGGAMCLIELLAKGVQPRWSDTNKRWLVGIDWLRSEPAALDLLAKVDRSQVRIHDGKEIVSRLGCTPRLPFHPKTFLLRGAHLDAAVVGSGNLSRNGFLRGHEVGTSIIVGAGSGKAEDAAREQLDALNSWFEALWKGSTPWRSIRSSYLNSYESRTNFGALTPTDDDAADTDDTKVSSRRGAFLPHQLRQLRAAQSLWIQAGTLSKNRGPKLSGNQLMMKRFTRVFFELPARDVARDTQIGVVTIRHKKFTRNDCTIRFSNNGMDVLLLPVPGNGGPTTYDDQILCFERVADGSYRLGVRAAKALSQFRKQSDALGSTFSMSGSGRLFGVY